MISDGLQAVEAKIARELATRSECFVHNPTERAVLERLTNGELRDFAHQNGWRVVRRVGGQRIQFYNDSTERLRNETARRSDRAMP
jgi:hypothetical protein